MLGLKLRLGLGSTFDVRIGVRVGIRFWFRLRVWAGVEVTLGFRVVIRVRVWVRVRVGFSVVIVVGVAIGVLVWFRFRVRVGVGVGCRVSIVLGSWGVPVGQWPIMTQDSSLLPAPSGSAGTSLFSLSSFLSSQDCVPHFSLVAVAYIDLQAVGAEITTVPKYPLPVTVMICCFESCPALPGTSRFLVRKLHPLPSIAPLCRCGDSIAAA